MASNQNPYGPSGGHSVITYLQKIRDGVVFSEGFENDNFISADGWTTIQGAPANSGVQFKQGIKSWDNNANGGIPIAKKVITDTNVDNFWLVQGWFYDDATNTTAQGPYLKAKLASGKYMSVGVRNSFSTTKYCFNAVTSAAQDDPQNVSSVTRTTGWHLFQMQLGNFGSYNMLIDGTLISNVSTTTSTVSEIYVQSNLAGGTGTSIGYFDSVEYYRSAQIQILMPTTTMQTVNFYTNQNSLLLSTTADSSSPAALNFVGTSYFNANLPIGIYTEISTATATSLGCRSNLIMMNPGDIYSYKTIDFGRKITTYDPTPKELQSVNISTAGVRETNNYGLKGDLSFSVRDLCGYQWRQSADNFFLNAVQGNPFGLMVDNVTDRCFGVIGTSRQPNSSTLQIMGNLGTNPTSQFSQKSTSTQDYYVIQNALNTNKQVVQFTAIATSSVTLSQPTNFATNPGDYVYSLLYYPFLEVNGNGLTGFRVTDPNIPRYNWTQGCSEYDNG